MTAIRTTPRFAADYLTDYDVLPGTHRFGASTNLATSGFVPAWSGWTPARLIVGSGWPEHVGWRTSVRWPASFGWEWTLGRYNWPPPTNFTWPRERLGLVSILQTEQSVVAVAADYLDDVTWLTPTLEAFERLLQLDADDEWHPRPDVEFVAEALTFFSSALPRDAAPPSVAPLNDGGLQVEWHRGGLDVEVIFSADDDERGVYIRDREHGEEIHLPLSPSEFAAAVGDRLNVDG